MSAAAQHCTGPRTPEGKAISSRNSLKLGLYAQTPILPGENPEELAQLTLDWETQFRPVGPYETALLHAVVRAYWFVQRYHRIEAEVINARYATMEEPSDTALGEIFIADAEGPNLLEKIFRRQQSADRQFHRALKDLRAAQQERLSQPPIPIEINAPAPDPVRFSNPPARPDVPSAPPHSSLLTPRSQPLDNPAWRL